MKQPESNLTLGEMLSMPDVVSQLVMQASSAEICERRADVRHPFFHPVTITPSNAPQSFSGFSREISLSGIGLLHNIPVERGDIRLSIRRTDEEPVSLLVRIVWCKPCGDGWFLSGGYFLPVR